MTMKSLFAKSWKSEQQSSAVEIRVLGKSELLPSGEASSNSLLLALQDLGDAVVKGEVGMLPLASPAPSTTDIENDRIAFLKLLSTIAAMLLLVESALKFMGYVPLFLVIVGLVILVFWRPCLKMDPAEPPLLKPKIPYIGHAIGFLRHQTKYLAILKYLSLRSRSLVHV
jgi:hypothetical protein